MLEAGVLIVGIGYLVTTLVADILYSLLNPRIRYGARRVTMIDDAAGSSRAGSAEPRHDRAPGDAARSCCARRRSSSGTSIVGFWVVLRALRAPGSRPTIRSSRSADILAEPERELLVRHRQARPRRLLARARGRARHPHGRAARDVARDRRRHDHRTRHGVLPRPRRRRRSAASSTPCSRFRSSIIAVTALVALGGSTRRSSSSSASSSPRSSRARCARPCSSERELDYVQAAQLRGERARTSCSSRSCRTSRARSSSRRPCGSATRSSPSPA